MSGLVQAELLFQRFHSQMFAQVVWPSKAFLLLCWSHSGRRSRSAQVWIVMWPKSSVSRTYKNCHMLPKHSCLMFYFSTYQMGLKWEVPSKTGCVYTWATDCYSDHKLLLWQLHSTRMRSVLSFLPYIHMKIYFPLFALLNTGLIW